MQVLKTGRGTLDVSVLLWPDFHILSKLQVDFLTQAPFEGDNHLQVAETGSSYRETSDLKSDFCPPPKPLPSPSSIP